MTAISKQLPLPLPVYAAQGAEDYLVTDSNREAVAWLDAWPEWPGQGLVLHGPPASGKSHLAVIWALRAGAQVLQGPGLTIEQALTTTGAVVVDGADQCDNPRPLFHLINHVRAGGHTLRLTAHGPALAWPVELPDLASRLRALPGAALHAPDEMLLTGLAAKLFADRQITVSDEIIALMLTRLERSCAAIAAAVDQIDRAALAAGRRVTLPLARAVLKSPNNSTNDTSPENTSNENTSNEN
jgi:chromosomal replication initiation ATPase DnaA